MPVATNDLNAAIASVEAEFNCRVKWRRARKLVEYVNRAWSADIKQDIRDVFSKVLLVEEVDLFGYFIYSKLLGRYYNPRALRAREYKRQSYEDAKDKEQSRTASAASVATRPKQRSLPHVIGEANENEAELQVYAELAVTVRARVPGLKRLKTFGEIRIVGTTILSGSSDYIHKEGWIAVHKMALATMNDHRSRIKRKKRLVN